MEVNHQSTRAIREALHAQNPHCHYCGRRINSKRRPTVDHVIPRSKGGESDPANLVLACRHCNACKADRTPAEWALVLIRQLDGVMAVIGETSPALLAD